MNIIKIYNPKAESYKLVEWKLHNVCNYSCSFCGPNSNSGSEHWLDISFYIDRINKFMDIAESENKKIWFTLTGGEPTLMPDFIEIPKHIKNRGHNVGILTNGSRTLRWWEEFAHVAPDNILISLHTQQGAKVDHVVKITEIFKNSPTNVLIIVTAPPNGFSESYSNFKYLVDNSIAVVCLRGIVFLRNKLMDGYTEEQKKLLSENYIIRGRRMSEKTQGWLDFPWQSVNVVFDDGHEEVNHGQYYIHREMYNFLGWKCTVGVDYLRIDHTKIWKGNCRQDGVIGDLLDDDFGFMKEPAICTQSGCTCSIEWNQPKWKILPK